MLRGVSIWKLAGFSAKSSARAIVVFTLPPPNRRLTFGGQIGPLHIRARSNMSHTTFPSDLPVPEDDGACDHLTDASLPSLALPIARQPSLTVDISRSPGLTVIFCYPRTGAPNETVPDSWNAIPGARGCTPQACSFRDNMPQLQNLGVKQVYGLSTQSPEYQAEVHERLHLPYDLLSDEKLKFQEALNLPTFEWEGKKVIRRLSMAIEQGKIVKWWYPVFPPDKGVDDVLDWLKQRRH